jgi:hypothetical protein
MTYARQLIAMLVLVVLAWGCIGGQTGSEGSISTGSGSCTIPRLDACTTDDDCRRSADAYAGRFASPSPNGPWKLRAAHCAEEESCGVGPRGCGCEIERSDGLVLPLLLTSDDCALRGRSLACLMTAAEVPACRPGTCDCALTCDHALELLNADEARTPDAGVRVASCDHGTCRTVFTVDDRCYAGLPDVLHEVDCTRSDDDLLRLASDWSFVNTSSCQDFIGICDPGTPERNVERCVHERPGGATAP